MPLFPTALRSHVAFSGALCFSNDKCTWECYKCYVYSVSIIEKVISSNFSHVRKKGAYQK